MSGTFHEFVVQRSPALCRTAYLLTGDHQHAEDLLQSALARTYRHWRRIRDGDPEAYVRRVMYHQQVSWWRRRRVAERVSFSCQSTEAHFPAFRRWTMRQAGSTIFDWVW